MAVRKKKDTSAGAESPKASKKRVSAKTTAEPVKKPKNKTRAEEIVEELQTVGADIVPSVALDVDVTVEDMPVAAADAVIDHRAIREHTIDQIAPQQENLRSLIADWDLHLFNEGTHHKLWQKLGAHIVPGGVIFGVWAPNAQRVSVIGDFNGWNTDANALQPV